MDILEFPGNMRVFQFMGMLGHSMGNRTLGTHEATKVIGTVESLHIAEIPAMLTAVCGKTLAEAAIGAKSKVTVVGIWDKGNFVPPLPHSVIHSTSVLLLAGSKEQLALFDEKFVSPLHSTASERRVLILGGGRVGLAAAEILQQYGLEYKIVEKRSALAGDDEIYVQGDAADIEVLKKAGIEEAGSVLVTTHNDAMNIYLTFYCRQLRPDLQIISRANTPSSVSKMYMAGADLVISYASMAVNGIMSVLHPDETGVMMEGIQLFKVQVPSGLVGKTLLESGIREKTGCSVIGIRRGESMVVGPAPDIVLERGEKLLVVGTNETQKKFETMYPEEKRW
jgi:Trk K+ transport system NAD-binding subunit